MCQLFSTLYPWQTRSQSGALQWSEIRSEILAGSVWHKGAYNRTFPCMEATYHLWHGIKGLA